ncbi:unnamed protein product [Calypogeia fissa]
MFLGSPSESLQASRPSGIVQINESVYELYRPVGKPSLQIVFFHGLQPGDYTEAHWATWQSGDRSCVWPQTWLAEEEIPDCQVFCVSYTGGLKTMSGVRTLSYVDFDLFLMSEIVMSDLIRADIGQVPHCPVVLVGHSIGGLIVKELCCHADEMPSISPDFGKAELEKFFSNLKGMAFYATPHSPSLVANAWAAIAADADVDVREGDLRLKFFIRLLKDIDWLNVKFVEMCRVHGAWMLAELWEHRPTKSMFRRGSFSGMFEVVVPEPRSRVGRLHIVEGADHFSICRPWNKASCNFSILRAFLDRIVTDSKEERRRLGDQNLQHLPKYLVGIDLQKQLITSRLNNVQTVGLVGAKGVGKSTLAMAIFNELGPKFEFSCFVSDVKLFKGNVSSLKDYVWKRMHRHGKKIGTCQPNWSELEGKQLILGLDDISDSGDCRDRKVLSEIVRITAPESRFILTSRDLKLRDSLRGDIFGVQFLEDDSAEQLFMNHALQNELPNYRIPSFLDFTRVVKAIIKHCEGLPLSLEVLGKYLSTKQNESDWSRTLRALNDAQKEKVFDHGSWEKLRIFYEALDESEQQIFEESIRGGQNFKKLLEKEEAIFYRWYEDPLTWEKMCDPAVCSDGRTYDRWTIIDQKMTRSPYDRTTTFAIVCDNIDVRSKLFEAFPEQEVQFRERRKKYREQALKHARSYPDEVADAKEKLTNVLKWLPLDIDCRDALSSLKIRLSQRTESTLQDDVPVGVPPVTEENQIPIPESREDIVSGVSTESVENLTSMMPLSTQEGRPASEFPPVVSHEEVIRARGVISHEDLIRERGRAFGTRLNTFMVFLSIILYIAIMSFLT